MVDLAYIVANPAFVRGYVGMLLAVTMFAIVHLERRLISERSAADKLVAILTDNEGPETCLRNLNFVTDARLMLGPTLVSDKAPPSERHFARRSGVMLAMASYLGAVTSTPAARHLLEGLRPSERFLRPQIARALPRPQEFGDVLIRLSLLGTFAGLVAALAIASANMNAEHAETAQMQGFLQQLLGSAAAKFWISASGLACALVLRLWQVRLARSASQLAEMIGLALDAKLARLDVIQAWCPGYDSQLDPISQQIHEIADKIRSSASKWILSIEIGSDTERRHPAITLSNRT